MKASQERFSFSIRSKIQFVEFKKVSPKVEFPLFLVTRSY